MCSRSRTWCSTLEVEELTVFTGWAEAAAEAFAHAPERAAAVLADARAGAAWRQTLGLAEPSQRLSQAIDCIGRAVRAASPPGGATTLAATAATLREIPPGESEVDGLVRRVLLAMVEARGTRRPEARPTTESPPLV
jgi:hypothetical protein